MGIAQISNFGRCKTTRGIIYTPKPESDGYSRIVINKKRHYIHRLAATSFNLPKATSLHNFVDHIDSKRSNNRIENLRWTTRQENNQNSYKNNKTRSTSGPKLSKPVLGCKFYEDTWVHYESSSDAANKLKLYPASVAACARGERNRTGDYKFVYATPNEPEFIATDEVWKIIPGSKSYISSYGRFRNPRGVASTPKPKVSGYAFVCINRKGYQVHRVVATVFELHKPSQSHTQIYHIDGDSTNNKIDNLRWATPSENIKASYTTNNNRASNVLRRCKPISGRKIGTNEWIQYAHSHEASDKLGIQQANISACALGKISHAGGYQFKYAESNEPEVLEGEIWKDVILE